MKTTILIIVVAVIGVTFGIGGVWFDIPQSEPAKELTSFIVLGCAILLIFGLLSIIAIKLEKHLQKKLKEIK